MMQHPTRRRRLLPFFPAVAALFVFLLRSSAAAVNHHNTSTLLESMLGSIPGVAQFFRVFWQEKPAVIRRHTATFYQPVMRSSDLDALLAFSQEGWKLVKRVKGEKDGEWWSSSPPTPASSSSSEGSDDADDLVMAAMRRVERAHAAFSQGYSLVVDRVDEKHDGVGRLAAVIEADVGHRVGVNLYWTPPDSQAFEAHFDWMDAFVLQVEGRKRWKLYDALVEQPRPDMKFKPTAAQIGEPFVDFVLEAGDLLYLPSGLIHEAHTLAEADGASPSLHLTVGVESTVFGSWESMLLELVAAATENDEETRQQDEGKDHGGEEVLGLRCRDDGPTLQATLSAAVDASSSPSPMRWGDLLGLLLVHLAGRERSLRRAVPLTPLLVEGAGGQEAVLQELSRLGSWVREKGAAADVGKVVRGMVQGERLKLPRSLGPLGSAGRRMQQRVEEEKGAGPSTLTALLDRPDVKEELRQALQLVECVLQSHPAAVMRRFAGVAARDREARQAHRKELLERLAWRVSVDAKGIPGEEVYAVGGRGGKPGQGGEL